MTRTAASSLSLVAGACVTIAAAVVLLEDRLIYYPVPYPDGLWDTAALSREGECRIEDRYFTASDGVRLHAWWCVPERATGSTAAMAVLWLHGNAGNLSHRADMLLRVVALPTRVLILDYRGYGRSEGRPSEAGLYRDARAAWELLTGELGVAPHRIVLLGKSLGGAVAVELASRVEPGGLIVQSSFTSAREVAARVFPLVPGFLVSSRFDSRDRIARVRCPKLFIHGTADEVIPHDLGRALFEAAPEPKLWLDVPGAGHNDVYLVGGEEYFAALRGFIAALAP